MLRRFMIFLPWLFELVVVDNDTALAKGGEARAMANAAIGAMRYAWSARVVFRGTVLNSQCNNLRRLGE